MTTVAEEKLKKVEASLKAARERTEKRRNTIRKHEEYIKKMEAKLEKDPGNDEYEYRIYSRKEDLRTSLVKLNELEKIEKGWEEKLVKAKAEAEKVSAIPPKFLKYIEDLTKEWDEWDKNRKETLKKEYYELGYREFIKKYDYAKYTFIWTHEDETHLRNRRASEDLIKDLFARVERYIGTPDDFDYLYVNGFNLNGYVSGKGGKVTVHSILAGGYNIQRLHVRVLVHKV